MSFGLDKTHCFQIQTIEWFVTGLIASVGAIAGTWLAGQLIYDSQFGITYQPNYLLYLSLLTGVIILILFVGFVFTKRTLSTSIKDLISTT